MPNLKSEYYTHTTYGGLNECIIINKYFAGSVLANCVGYAWGRIYELSGQRPAMGKGHAKTLWDYNDGYTKTQEPSAGDIATWTGGDFGHVAVVEHVHDNGDIDISESDYYRDGSGYATKTLTKASGYDYGSGLSFQGFQQTEATAKLKEQNKESDEMAKMLDIIDIDLDKRSRAYIGAYKNGQYGTDKVAIFHKDTNVYVDVTCDTRNPSKSVIKKQGKNSSGKIDAWSCGWQKRKSGAKVLVYKFINNGNTYYTIVDEK